MKRLSALSLCLVALACSSSNSTSPDALVKTDVPPSGGDAPLVKPEVGPDQRLADEPLPGPDIAADRAGDLPTSDLRDAKSQGDVRSDIAGDLPLAIDLGNERGPAQVDGGSFDTKLDSVASLDLAGDRGISIDLLTSDTGDSAKRDAASDNAGDVSTCSAETDDELCVAVGQVCGILTTKDRCAVARTVASCGVCTGDQACGANGLVGQCSVPAPLSSLPAGVPLSLLPQYFDGGIFAIRAVSADEVWLASHTVLVRVRLRPSTIASFFPAALAQTDTHGQMWASSPSDVWLASGTVLLHFDGTSWTTVDAGLTAGSTMTAIHGTANDDIWVAGAVSNVAQIRHFDGTTWSAWSVPTSSGLIKSIAGSTRGTPYLVGNDMYQWNGLSYVTLPRKGRQLWVSPTGTVFSFGITCDQGYNSAWDLYRLDDTKWTRLASNSRAHEGCASVYQDSNLAGVNDTEVWAGGPWGAGIRYTGAPTNLAGYMMAPTGVSSGYFATSTQLYELVGGTSILRFDASPSTYSCPRAFADGTGGAWLKCSGGLGRFEKGMLTQTTTSSAISGFYTAPSMSVWLALSTGALEQRSASGTITHSNYLGSKFAAIAGTSDSNVWAVTTDGGAAHFDGVQWTASSITLPTNQQLTSVAASVTSAWAATSASMFQWSGSAWTAVTLPTTSTTVLDIWAYNGAPWILARLASNSTALYSWDGSAWKERRTWTDVYKTTSGIDASGVLTLHQDDTGNAVLERWQDSGPTTIGTISNARMPGATVTALTMPTATSALYGSLPLYWVGF